MGSRERRGYPLFRSILIEFAQRIGAGTVCETYTQHVERRCILLRTSVISRSHRATVVAELARIADMVPEHLSDMRRHIELTRQELSAAMT